MALSRDQMIGIINGGGSVLVAVGGKKRLVASVEKLPSAAELARTDGEKQVAAADIDAQIAALQAQRNGLIPAESGSEQSAANSGAQDSDSIDDTVDELMKHTRAELVEKASALGLTVGDTDNKTQISEAILAKQAAQ